MGADDLPELSVRLGLCLAVAMAAGCTGESWACGVSAVEGCFCTFDEVLTEPTSECTASATGSMHCCDDPVADECVCPGATECFEYIDNGICGCARVRPDDTIPIGTSCDAAPGEICCRTPASPGALGLCVCGFVGECPLPEMIVSTSCTAADVASCNERETEVSSCSLRE